ncbi:MlaC/ttg2D family ABC transporter substrate-binding protein [Methylomicrobium sp. RS1]|jgi:phospholipid transport system substrate-binding protein|uniref:MlaC/ttg2D family ABC transporter substrate-binding protein n=1 Tax=Candidatus Methylomicrobium oryzae TaxID=2802053 RepID=UPI001923A6A1|nr:ABC transporter substrate-binding protein [Methylomicrobium sp. RS1]MBL1262505.1 ABC transporter substrate-binding protein [Methylomicrobium sp. RS1]
MQNLIKKYALLGLVVLGLIPVTHVTAGGLQEPQQVIQDVSEQLRQRFQDKAFTRDFAQVTRFVDGVIYPHADFDVIAPLVLGKHWKTASPAERERFKNEFRTLLVRSYSRAFVEYNNWNLRFQPIDAGGGKKVVVKTEVLQPGQKPVQVNYRMFQGKGGWKVYDIIIEGVSLVTNYRSSFSEDIQKKGSLSALNDSLAKRNAEALNGKGS